MGIIFDILQTLIVLAITSFTILGIVFIILGPNGVNKVKNTFKKNVAEKREEEEPDSFPNITAFSKVMINFYGRNEWGYSREYMDFIWKISDSHEHKVFDASLKKHQALINVIQVILTENGITYADNTEISQLIHKKLQKALEYSKQDLESFKDNRLDTHLKWLDGAGTHLNEEITTEELEKYSGNIKDSKGGLNDDLFIN